MGEAEFIAIGAGAAFLVPSVLFWWRDGVRRKKVHDFLSHGAPLIDVSPPERYEKTHIEGARNIPLEQLGKRATEIGPPGQAVVVCGHGSVRRTRATHELEALGYRVMNAGWTRFSMTERPPPGAPSSNSAW